MKLRVIQLRTFIVLVVLLAAAILLAFCLGMGTVSADELWVKNNGAIVSIVTPVLTEASNQ